MREIEFSHLVRGKQGRGPLYKSFNHCWCPVTKWECVSRSVRQVSEQAKKNDGFNRGRE